LKYITDLIDFIIPLYFFNIEFLTRQAKQRHGLSHNLICILH